MGKIRKPDKNKGKRISANETVDYDESPPIFSLERLQGGKHCFSRLESDDKAAFAESIFRRRGLKWKDIKKEGRHGLGFEKIALSSIKAQPPRFITQDEKHVLAFRFSGMKPMVGIRQKNIFYVIWFDKDFTLYDH
jgi:hypothetical protein